VAGDDRHLTIDARRRVRLLEGPAIDGHRPSGTRMLLSLASELGPRAVGVVLTGMGRDGAEGLRALRRAGGRTLVQDEATSVVYGMPRAALDGAEASVPLSGLAPALIALAGRAR
jgi:two-component system chemotaxis response regulator CheB